MLVVDGAQMDSLAANQREMSLVRIARMLCEHDLALCGGRTPGEILPTIQTAARNADEWGLSLNGAVALIAMIELLVEADPESREGLRPLDAALSDPTKPAADRMERAWMLLFDLEESLPPELRRHQLIVTPTPELDI